ncbi:MAG: hypothetical protein GX660_06915 [Clostridiaceae bacterium]|nr:hypothetical protein [Clostridiaceae bacterium]
MLTIQKSNNYNGIELKGDFFDLDRLYFAILKFTGFHGIKDKCCFPGYDNVCEYLLGLCYEIRHSWQGDRDLEEVYNGVDIEWFDDYLEHSVSEIDNNEYEFEDDSTEECGDENKSKFSRSNFPNVTNFNTYFKIIIPFPEAILYTLILLKLLNKKEQFFLLRKELSEIEGPMQELNKEYYLFQSHEDISRIQLYVQGILLTLYRFLGKDKFDKIMCNFNNTDDLFLIHNIEDINDIITEYGEHKYTEDNPDVLFHTIISFFE